MTKYRWTAEEDTMLTRLVTTEGKSFGVAALEMSAAFKQSAVKFTRNACISRAHRLGIGNRIKTQEKPCNRPPGKRSSYGAPSKPVLRLNRPSILKQLEYQPPRSHRPIELVDGTCQYIDHRSNKKCSSLCDGNTNWCEAHRRICYQPRMT